MWKRAGFPVDDKPVSRDLGVQHGLLHCGANRARVTLDVRNPLLLPHPVTGVPTAAIICNMGAASHGPEWTQASAQILKFMGMGAIGFWAPDIAWHAIRGSQFDGRDVIGITVLLPLSFLGTYILIRRSHGRQYKKPPILRWMLLGLWLLGGFLLMVAASFSGAGFALGDRLQALAISLIPGIAYILAAYDGSLGALLIVTVVPLIIWLVRVVRQFSQPS
jgi:hypothetical protein